MKSHFCLLASLGVSATQERDMKKIITFSYTELPLATVLIDDETVI